MTAASRREAALAELDQARLALEAAVRRAPDAALRYRPPGADYALGGLVVHLTDILRQYAPLIGALHHSTAPSLEAPEPEAPTSTSDADLLRHGFPGERRAAVLDELRSAHAALVAAARAAPEADFARQVTVTAGSAAPYPASPADVVGWVRDHYRAQAQQIHDLVTAWADTTR